MLIDNLYPTRIFDVNASDLLLQTWSLGSFVAALSFLIWMNPVRTLWVSCPAPPLPSK